MNILVISGMSDEKLLSKIKPLSMSHSVDRIFVVRDKSGPKLKKVEYQSLSNTTKLGIIRNLIKFFMAIRLCKTRKIDVIICFYFVPHGILSFFVQNFSENP